jgi:hypothetical protein
MKTRSPRRALCLAAVLAAGALLGACTVEPWVKPYERERLADPVMNPARDALADKHHEHVFDVREGARGATGVQGGGCGCN